jgi:hypothetical protein
MKYVFYYKGKQIFNDQAENRSLHSIQKNNNFMYYHLLKKPIKG